MTAQMEVITRTGFDLETMEEVTLQKGAPFAGVETQQEGLERVGNDAKVFIDVFNAGLRQYFREKLAEDSSVAWNAVDEDGKAIGEFSGKLADPAKVNTLVLSLAKSVFGYSKDLPIEMRRKAKEMALTLIKSNEAMKAGLQKNAAA